MMPAAVTVATVADPVATRMSAAMNQARSRMPMPLAPCANEAMTWPIPVSTRTCLNPPPAPTMSRMPAMGGSAAVMLVCRDLRFIPPGRPRRKNPASTAMVSAMAGVPRKSRIVFHSAVLFGAVMSATAFPSISTTGRRMLMIAAANDGRLRSTPVPVVPSASPSGSRYSPGTSTGTHLAANRLNTGPARTIVGMATSTPKASVTPRFAPRAPIATSGPGCGGTRPCMADSPAIAGSAIRISGSPERRVTRMITGMSSTRPISKNIGRPMIAPTRPITHGRARTLVRETMVSTMRSAPPESASSFPYIAPSAMRMPTLPSVAPNPVMKLVVASPAAMPATRPVTSAPRSRERNGWTRSHVMSTTITATPTMAAVISCGSAAEGWGVGAGAAAAATRSASVIRVIMSILGRDGTSARPH